MIDVRLEGHLERFRADHRKHFIIDLHQGATVRDLIDASGVPWEAVGVAAVNGVHAEDVRGLEEGDQVILLAPIEGG